MPTASRPIDSANNTKRIHARATNAQVDPRAVALRRMRLVATLLLVAMTIIYIAASTIEFDWPGLPYLRAFAEAGMVGACADWFAVVALFRQPLGLPIPHTGIIPNNKERIGNALGRFITDNFLTRPVIGKRLARVDVIGSIAIWLDDPANAKRMADHLARLLPRIVESIPGQPIGETLGNWAHQALTMVPAAPVAAKLLQILWAQGEAQEIIASAIAYSQDYLAKNREYLGKRIVQRSRWIPGWIDKMLADKVMDGMLSTLTEMRDPGHPWRVELRRAVEKLIVQLESDPQMQERGEYFKAQLLANPLVMEQARHLWIEVESGLKESVSARAETIARTFEQMLGSSGKWLQEDPNRQARLNRRIRAVARRLLLAYRFEIGGYIERVVRNWDSSTLVRRLELQVGKDLQFIRINGTLVGGLVGLLIFVASKWMSMI